MDADKLKQTAIVGGSIVISRLLAIPVYKIGVYNGVAVRNLRLLNANNEYPTYEKELIKQIREFVDIGDSVVVVGAGLGVSSVATSRQTGSEGYVTSFEASRHRYNIASDTIHLNNVEDRIDLQHAVVGEAKNVFKSQGNATSIPANDLPEDRDVLIMDCEGAERNILENMDSLPPTIIVETHGVHGSPTERVERILNDHGYAIKTKAAENAEKDVYVLAAVTGE